MTVQVGTRSQIRVVARERRVGSIVRNAGVVVTNVGTGAAATVYSDEDLTTPISSLVTDGSGVFSFYAPPGTYSISFTGSDAFEAVENVHVVGDDTSPTGTYVFGSGVTVNPLQYGAVGGNETADTAAFVAAIAAAGVNGTINVSWAPGKLPYVLTPATIALLDGMTIQAQGWRPKIQKGTGTGPLFSATSVTGPAIRGLHLIGTAVAQASGDYGVQFVGTTNGTVQECEVEGMGWDAIAFDTQSNVRARVLFNVVHNNYNHGITVTVGRGQGSDDMEVGGNLVYSQPNGFGIVCGYTRTQTGGIDIAVDATLVVDTAGIMIDADVGATVSIPGAGPAGATLVTTITSIVAYNPGQYHIATPASTTVTGKTITFLVYSDRAHIFDNTVRDAAQIQDGGMQFIYLAHANVHDNTTENVAVSALISNCVHSKWVDHIAYNSSPGSSFGAAMYVNGSDHVTIDRPKIDTVISTGAGLGNGIRVIAGTTNTRIRDAEIYTPGNHGIFDEGTDTHVIGGNIERVANIAVFLSVATRPKVKRVAIEGYTSGAVTTSGATTGARVQHCEISNLAALGSNPTAVTIGGSTTGFFGDNDIHDIGTGTRYSGTGAAGTVIRDDIREGSLPIKTVAGAVSDASFVGGVTPISGVLGIDTTNSQLYVRVGSTWKKVAVA